MVIEEKWGNAATTAAYFHPSLLPLLLSRDVNNYIQTETIYFIKEGASTLTKLWAH